VTNQRGTAVNNASVATKGSIRIYEQGHLVGQ
jgi:hypothetical protein